MCKKAVSISATLIIVVLSSALLYAASPESSLDQLIDMLLGVHVFEEVVLSPDGRRVAWVESLQGSNGAPTPGSAIYVADLSSRSVTPRRITVGDGTAAYSEHNVAWSPDGERLAFLSDKDSEGQPQLYVAYAVGGLAQKLTSLTGTLSDPSWSPDGKVLALLFTENSQRPPGPTEPFSPPLGVIEQHIFEQRLTTLDLASGQVRQISPPDLYIYQYDWSPDGKSIVATAAHGAGDANWYIAQLYAIDVASGKVKSLYTPPVDMQIAVPRWSPDGENIAFIGGLMSDEGNTGGDIFALPAKGGKPQNLTPNLKASPSWLAWVSSSQILFSEQIDGESGLEILDTSDGKVTRLWKSQESNSTGGWTFGVSPARDGKTCALLLQGFQQPPEIWAGPIGAWKPVTHANRSLQPMWGKAESLHWSSEGCNIQGWLVYPRDYDPSRHYPLVVKVHGGPGDALRPNWPEVFFSITPLSYAGYFVLFPNPRGSFGQGEAFTRANVNDFGGGDLRDILAGIDAVEKEVPVDDSRIGIVGWSYGGFMTMWAVTQTNRFHAAVAGAGIANWLSYYGENYIDLWMRPFFGASVYDDPVVYAQRSPINFIKNVKTPTLILVGERDEECPVPQSLEFWHALKTLGVPNQFVVYPGEGHQIRQPVHQRDILERTIAWFNKYLQ